MNLFMETIMKKHFFKEIKPHKIHSKLRKSAHSNVKKDRRIRTKLRALARSNHDVSAIDFEQPFRQTMRRDQHVLQSFELTPYWPGFGSSRVKRFLQSRTGRSWDDVYSEIRTELNPDNYAEFRILSNLKSYVLNHRKAHSWCYSVSFYRTKICRFMTVLYETGGACVKDEQLQFEQIQYLPVFYQSREQLNLGQLMELYELGLTVSERFSRTEKSIKKY